MIVNKPGLAMNIAQLLQP